MNPLSPTGGVTGGLFYLEQQSVGQFDSMRIDALMKVFSTMDRCCMSYEEKILMARAWRLVSWLHGRVSQDIGLHD